MRQKETSIKINLAIIYHLHLIKMGLVTATVTSKIYKKMFKIVPNVKVRLGIKNLISLKIYIICNANLNSRKKITCVRIKYQFAYTAVLKASKILLGLILL